MTIASGLANCFVDDALLLSLRIVDTIPSQLRYLLALHPSAEVMEVLRGDKTELQ